MNPIKNLIIIVIIAFPDQVLGQFLNGIDSDFGLHFHFTNMKEKQGYSSVTEATERTIYLNLKGKSIITKNEKLSIGFGLGIGKDIIGFQPLIKIKETNISDHNGYDTIVIYEYGKVSRQFIFPMILTLQLSKPKPLPVPIFAIPGIKLNIGLENKINYGMIDVESHLIYNYNESTGTGTEFENETLSDKVNEYYKTMFRNYSLIVNGGIEIFHNNRKFGFRTGINYNYYLLCPVKCETSNNYGFSFYIGTNYNF